MALDITKMPAYISRATKGKNFLGKAILESTTIEFLERAEDSFHPNIKGTEAIDLLDSTVVLQDGTISGLDDGENNFEFDHVDITPKNIKTTHKMNQFQLEKTWLKYGLKAGQHYTELAFATDLTEHFGKKISATNERLLWLGDTASADVNMKQTDGFIKRIKASVAVDLTAYLTGDTILKKLRSAYLAIDEIVRQKDDFRLIISMGVYALIAGDTFDLNLFKAADENYLPGTQCRIEIASGTAGTNFALFARLQSLHAGTDLFSDLSYIKAVYGDVSELLYLNARYTLGTAIAYAEEMAYVDLSAAVGGDVEGAGIQMLAAKATKATKTSKGAKVVVPVEPVEEGGEDKTDQEAAEEGEKV